MDYTLKVTLTTTLVKSKREQLGLGTRMRQREHKHRKAKMHRQETRGRGSLSQVYLVSRVTELAVTPGQGRWLRHHLSWANPTYIANPFGQKS